MSGASDELRIPWTRCPARLSSRTRPPHLVGCYKSESPYTAHVGVTRMCRIRLRPPGIAGESLASADQGKLVIDRTTNGILQMAGDREAGSSDDKTLSKRTDEIGSIVGDYQGDRRSG